MAGMALAIASARAGGRAGVRAGKGHQRVRLCSVAGAEPRGGKGANRCAGDQSVPAQPPPQPPAGGRHPAPARRAATSDCKQHQPAAPAAPAALTHRGRWPQRGRCAARGATCAGPSPPGCRATCPCAPSARTCTSARQQKRVGQGWRSGDALGAGLPAHRDGSRQLLPCMWPQARRAWHSTTQPLHVPQQALPQCACAAPTKGLWLAAKI